MGRFGSKRIFACNELRDFLIGWLLAEDDAVDAVSAVFDALRQSNLKMAVMARLGFAPRRILVHSAFSVSKP